MINILDKKDCCGCTACASICPRSAIEMKPDVLGFIYPEIDKNKCTDCGLCDKVCAFNDNYDKSLNLSEPIAYAVRHKDMAEIMKSQSGGAFAVLSDYVLENGGVVYGVGYNGHFVATHKRAVTKEQRDEFRGSKYVQSDLTGIFKQVKDDLKNGQTVLFSGTPCQTAGLNSFVGKTLRKKLYLVDLICHGVPGPFMWRDYLNYLENKYKRKIIKVNFRDKAFGWKSHKETFLFAGSTSSTSFTYIFYEHIAFRMSCGNCHFTNLKRPGDITICDYWGCERTDPKLGEDNQGCSLMICDTAKGLTFFESVRDRMNIVPARLENIIQPNMEHPSVLHPKRLDFENDYEKHGFKYVLKKYGTEPLWKRAYRFARKCGGKVLRMVGLKK
ncbi:MAG: Coenzyme F420 hydrogenase/dehydrogenase, beta subunit C-terminal domain [Bacteroidales bacterium]|nr:Coenzyme F420 hydrogenase/dehydrogenase, beta subunit C-terminal domain [Bacteroidales bacterium]